MSLSQSITIVGASNFINSSSSANQSMFVSSLTYRKTAPVTCLVISSISPVNISLTALINLYSLGYILYISIGRTTLCTICDIDPDAIPEGTYNTAFFILSGANDAVLNIIPAPWEDPMKIY